MPTKFTRRRRPNGFCHKIIDKEQWRRRLRFVLLETHSTWRTCWSLRLVQSTFQWNSMDGVDDRLVTCIFRTRMAINLWASLSPFQHHSSSFRCWPWPLHIGHVRQNSTDFCRIGHFRHPSLVDFTQLFVSIEHTSLQFICGTETRSDESEKQNKEQFEWQWLHLCELKRAHIYARLTWKTHNK